MPKIRAIRTNAHGLPGKYACDRCGQASPKGVYTGFSGFEHVCPSCKTDIKAGEHSVSRIPSPKRVLSDTQKEAMRRGLAKSKPVVKFRKMDIPSFLATIDHGLTAAELSKIIGIPARTLYRQAKTGLIPSFHVGFAVRFDPHVIGEWLRAR